MGNQKIEPCPYCGGVASAFCRTWDLGEPWKVCCMDPKCQGSGPIRADPETAIKRWNKVSKAAEKVKAL